ncbi:MAG: hypothetical protein KKD18_04400, partial [Nanoarchaeota archaeon]|nr:hypothetical protein [Nanoarchaeota archaeon]
ERLSLPVVSREARRDVTRRFQKDPEGFQLDTTKELFFRGKALAERLRNTGALPNQRDQAAVYVNWLMPLAFSFLFTQAQTNANRQFSGTQRTSVDMCEYETVQDPKATFRQFDANFVPLRGDGIEPYFLWRREEGTLVYARANPELGRNFIAFVSLRGLDRAVLGLVKEFQEKTPTELLPLPFDPSHPNHHRLNWVMSESTYNPYFVKYYDRNIAAATSH